MSDEGQVFRAGYKKTFVLLVAGAVLYAFAFKLSFDFVDAGHRLEGAGYVLAAVLVTPLFGTPLVIATYKSDHFVRRAFYFFVLLPVIHSAAAAANLGMLFGNDVGGSDIYQLWSWGISGAIGGAGAMLFALLLGLAARFPFRWAVTIGAVVALGLVAQASMYIPQLFSLPTSLAMSSIWLRWLLWQATLAFFLAVLLKHPEIEAGEWEEEQA